MLTCAYFVNERIIITQHRRSELHTQRYMFVYISAINDTINAAKDGEPQIATCVRSLLLFL